MRSTRSSLLLRLRDSGDAAAWREFELAYRELLVRYCLSRGLQRMDAEDVTQAVFLELSRALPRFTLDRQRGRFRDYLFTCVRRAIARLRARPIHHDGLLDPDAAREVADEHPSPSEAGAWEEEWTAHHYRLAMDGVRQSFDARSVSMFERFLAGASVADVAAEFEVSADAVYKVRRRIRERMEALIAEQIRAEDGLDELEDAGGRLG